MSPETNRVHLLRFWSERRPGAGEDAKPVCLAGRTRGAVAVCDGMGGAGSAIVSTERGDMSQARLAAFYARNAVKRTLMQTKAHLDPELLTANLRRDFAAVATHYNLGGGRLRSRMLRILPTTLALGHYEKDGEGYLIRAVWAGDSRVYLLSPDSGLQQLTADDLRSQGDAMANLVEDSPLSNMISASAAFTLNTRVVRTGARPLALIAATDGCFGYVPTPLHFEALLLRALGAAASYEAWQGCLKDEVLAVAGDDASMAVALPDPPSWTAFRKSFADRAAMIGEQAADFDAQQATLEAARARLAEEEAQAARRRTALWEDYRGDYEYWLREAEQPPPAPESAPPKPLFMPPAEPAPVAAEPILSASGPPVPVSGPPLPPPSGPVHRHPGEIEPT